MREEGLELHLGGEIEIEELMSGNQRQSEEGLELHLGGEIEIEELMSVNQRQS